MLSARAQREHLRDSNTDTSQKIVIAAQKAPTYPSFPFQLEKPYGVTQAKQVFHGIDW